jgi:hypothetical protein
MDAAMIPSEERIITAAGYLRDNALQFYLKKKRETPGINWEEFQKQLKQRFRSPNFQKDIFIQLSSIRQTGTLGQYIDQFTLLANQADETPEHIKVHLYLTGLEREVASAVDFRNPSSLDQAVQYTRDYERSYRSTPKAFLPPAETSFSQSYPTVDRYVIICYKCRKPGHKAFECRSSRSSSKERRPIRYDNRYQRERHSRERSSDRKHSRGHSPARHQKVKFRETEEPMEVNILKEREELSSSINNLLDNLRDKSKSLAYVEGKVMGVETRMILDTGARHSVISREFVERYNIPFQKQKIKISNADERVVDSVGVTEEIEVDIEGIKCNLEMIVLPMKKKSVLLGIDWSDKTGAEISTQQNLIQIGKKQIYLTRDSDLNQSYLIDEHSEQCPISTLDVGTDTEGTIKDWSEPSNAQKPPDIDDRLTKEEKQQVLRIIEDNKDIFARSIEDIRLPAKCDPFRIELIDSKPISVIPYRKSLSENQLIAKEVEKMRKAGIIRKTKSNFASPVLVTIKKNGEHRFCIDYRKLNQKIVADAYPIPRIDDILDKLSKSKYFTKIDLKSGYWQIPVHEDSVKYTAFATADGHYEFIRLPFGLKTAPAHFCRVIREVMDGLEFVADYFDDLTIHSSSLEDHLSHIQVVFDRMRGANLKANWDKCEWAKNEIFLLGYIISADGVKMDPSKIKTVRDWPVPKKANQLQQFLGLSGYYRKFIEKFSEIAKPLYDLLKKDNGWKWTKDCQEAFDKLKSKLTSYPILAKVDLSEPFTIYTDASGYALGAILSQQLDGQERVIQYASRLLKGAENNYGITEKECLAIIWAVQHFDSYLKGTKFKIVTDHAALQWLQSIKNPSGKMARWILYLQQFTFDIIHRSGRKHTNVDVLSRPVVETNILNNHIEEEEELDWYENENLMTYLKTGKFIPGSSRKSCKKAFKLAESLRLEDTTLWVIDKNNELKKVPKPGDREELINKYHKVGHFNQNEVLNRLRKKYFWPRMAKQIQTIVRNCILCAQFNRGPKMHHLPEYRKIEGLFHTLLLDCVFGFPITKEGYVGIFFIIEKLSRYIYGVPIRSKNESEIAKELFIFMSMFGVPYQILSDNGKEFVNKIV